MGHGYYDDTCIVCGKPLTYGHKTPYCRIHLNEKQNKDKIDKWLQTGDTGCAVSTTLRNCIREYIYNFQNNKCAICGLTREWNGKTLNFILDYIDGNAANNKQNNLRLICPNCDSQLDTFKSKNKSSARTFRKN